MTYENYISENHGHTPVQAKILSNQTELVIANFCKLFNVEPEIFDGTNIDVETIFENFATANLSTTIKVNTAGSVILEDLDFNPYEVELEWFLSEVARELYGRVGDYLYKTKTISLPNLPYFEQITNSEAQFVIDDSELELNYVSRKSGELSAKITQSTFLVNSELSNEIKDAFKDFKEKYLVEGK